MENKSLTDFFVVSFIKLILTVVFLEN